MMDVFKRVVATSVLSLAAIVNAAVGPWDADVADFPRQSGEVGDSARILRAVEKAGSLIWCDNQPLNFTDEEMKDLNDELKIQGESDKSTANNAKLAG